MPLWQEVIAEAFLVCAMSLPAKHHTRPVMVASKRDEIQDLKDFIRRGDPGAEVFITPKGQPEKLHDYGWEKVPFNWNGQEIWIQRKPKSDKRMETSA